MSAEDRPTVLLVDDDEAFRERLARALRDRGYEVRTADGYDAALQLARADSPEYAVVDLRARFSITPAITLVGEVRNLLNHRYATFGTFSEIDEIFLAEAPGAHDPRAYAPGAPRRAAISVKFGF